MTFEPISGRPTVTLNWESIRSLAVVQGGFWPHTTFQTEFGIFRVFPGNDAVQLARLAEASSHVRPN